MRLLGGVRMRGRGGDEARARAICTCAHAAATSPTASRHDGFQVRGSRGARKRTPVAQRPASATARNTAVTMAQAWDQRGRTACATGASCEAHAHRVSARRPARRIVSAEPTCRRLSAWQDRAPNKRVRRRAGKRERCLEGPHAPPRASEVPRAEGVWEAAERWGATRGVVRRVDWTAGVLRSRAHSAIDLQRPPEDRTRRSALARLSCAHAACA